MRRGLHEFQLKEQQYLKVGFHSSSEEQWYQVVLYQTSNFQSMIMLILSQKENTFWIAFSPANLLALF